MNAGRELDALVAEKVFGGHNQNVQWYWWIGSSPSLPIDPPLYAGPHFSTDIGAAWLVVEAMEAKRKYVCVEVTHRGWNAWVGNANADADTAPLAICIAALAAVGAEVPS